MSNANPGNILFGLQAPSTAIYRVGPANLGFKFSTITAAIAAAVADGHTDSSNPATIEVYPGTYTENPTISAGITLQGMAAGVTVVGSLFVDFSAGAVATNIVNVVDINVTGSASIAIVVDVIGAVGGSVNFTGARTTPAIESNAAGTGSRVFRNNSVGGITVRFFNYGLRSNNTLDPIILDAQTGTTEFYGTRCGLLNNSGGTLASGVQVSGTATVNVLSQSFVAGAFTKIVDIQGAGAAFNASRTTIQNTLVGGIMFLFTAAGTCRARHCVLILQDNTSLIGSGAAGNLNLISNQYGGTISAPFTTVANGINVNMIGTYAGQRSNNANEFYVGRGVGYSTIQAAITAANAAATGTRKIVMIAPGSYNENLTLQPNVDLVADTQGIASNSFSPVTITGTHTLAFTAINQTVNLKNIRFQSLLTNGTAMFAISGAFSGVQFRAQDCVFNKSFAGAATVFSVTTSAQAFYLFQDCQITLASDGGSVFDLSGATATPRLVVNQQMASTNTPVGTSIAVTHQSGGAPVQILLLNCPAAGGCFVDFTGVNIAVNTSRVVNIATNADALTFFGSKIIQTVDAGEMFYYAGAGLVNLINASVQQNDAGGGGTKLIGEDAGGGGSMNYGATVVGFGVVNTRASLTTTAMTETLTGV